jgi:DNA polymerase-3 subunit delta'
MSWQHIRGHDSLIQAFDQVIQRGRLAHAYLFVGPAGVGKRLFADELAKALLCEGERGRAEEEKGRRGEGENRGSRIEDRGSKIEMQPRAILDPPSSILSDRPHDHSPLTTHHSLRLEACDRCAACKLVDAGTHPDLQIARRPDDKSEVPVEVVRGLARSLDLKPARGRGRIVILDDADDLNEESANCFLKTLEEPPPGALLILIGTSADRQLPTIVSRCQVIPFRPLPEGIVAGLLTEKGIEDRDFVQRLARLSDGSVSMALALADPALWEFRRNLLNGLTQPRPDGVGLAQEWIKFVEEAGKELAVQRRRAALVLRLLIDFLNDALSMSVGKSPRLAEAADLPLLQKMVKLSDPDRLLAMIDRCLEADVQIDRNVQLVLVLEALVDSLTAEPVA